MKRRHWIEISDEPWCPRGIRNAVTDYCRFVTELSGIYNAVAPLLIDALKRTGGFHITMGQPSVLRVVRAFAQRPSVSRGRAEAAASVLRDAFAQAWRLGLAPAG